MPTLSTEQHWAEKLHAYTLPRDGATNSRVKDLVDLVLLIERQSMSPTRINVAVAATFARRGTHAVPTDLPPPPNVWEKPFMALAAECGVRECWLVHQDRRELTLIEFANRRVSTQHVFSYRDLIRSTVFPDFSQTAADILAA